MDIRYLLIILFSFLFSCYESPRNRILSKTDRVWLDFQKAMKTKDIKYLLANSNDKIQCFDCNLIEGNSNDFYNSTFIFNNHLDKLMHINDLQDNEFTTYEQDGEMIVTYSITAKFAEEGGYNLFFIFNVTETGYKFKGMTLT